MTATTGNETGGYMVKCLFLILGVLTSSGFCQAFSFTQSPTLTKESADRWVVRFGVNRATDVAVSIVNVRDSAVIRHLAAGVLGPDAPAPLAKDSLSQSLVWDGKDNLGNSVNLPDSLIRVRVRVGMSVQLLNLLGDNPYSFTKGLSWNGGSVEGMLRGTDGSVFICGSPGCIMQSHWGEPFLVVRQFDRNGDYVKTLYPFPAGLTPAQVQGWGVCQFPDNAYIPKHTNTSVPGFSTTILAVQKHPKFATLLMLDPAGNPVFGSRISALAIGVDGSMPSTGVAAPLATTPPIPISSTSGTLGSDYVTPIPGTRKIYLSGFFQATTTSGHLVTAPDTNFYHDGQVFKVDLATGAVQSWLALDSVPETPTARLTALGGNEFYASIHGTALDSQGRVYVCDRLHKRIGVYDSNAVMLGQIPFNNPENVAVSGKTGAIYAIAGYSTGTSTTGYVRLFKFAPYDQGAQRVCSLNVAQVASRPVQLIVNETATETRVWVGSPATSVKIYEDQGDKLALYRDFMNGTSNITQGFDRIVVDRRNETVYFNDNWYGIYKIKDWSDPRILVCSTSTRTRLHGTDMAISPSNLLYVRAGTTFSGPVKRFTLDHLHAPANWANTNNNMLTPYVDSRYGGGTGERGMAVAPDGRVAVMGQYTREAGAYRLFLYADSGSAADTFGNILISLPLRCGGVKFDLKGNLYLGAKTNSPDHLIPAPFTGDWAYGASVGALLRFSVGVDTGTVSDTQAFGHDKIYSLGLAPYSKEFGGGGCICRNPRFDVDPYGRIFAPNATACHVTVADNAGNQIIQFGGYGNVDSRGGLPGPGRTVTSPAIPFAWPTGVAASEDYIYVADFANCRLARLGMVYELDNLPGLTVHGTSLEQAAMNPIRALSLSSLPNPFSTHSSVRLNLPRAATVKLAVCDINGRMIKDILAEELSAGTHNLAWDGTDNQGRHLAAGVYYYRLQAGHQAIHRKTVLTR